MSPQAIAVAAMMGLWIVALLQVKDLQCHFAYYFQSAFVNAIHIVVMGVVEPAKIHACEVVMNDVYGRDFCQLVHRHMVVCNLW